MDLLGSRNLKILKACADQPGFSDEVFQALLEFSYDSILDSSLTSVPEELGKIDAVFSKSLHTALVALILEAAKVDIQEDELVMLLDECLFPPSMKEVFIGQFKDRRSDVRDHLSAIGFRFPHVQDLDWRLDYNIKNNQLHKVDKLRYTLSLDVKNGRKIDFTCSREELQDFSAKLKEAVKAVERAAQS